MKYYEAIFIAHPSLEDAALAKLVNETKEIFLKRGGEIIYEEDMGKKRLAYPIDRQRFGNYQLLHLQSEELKNAQLNRDLEHKDDILAHMIVRIEKDQVLEPQPKPEVEAVAETKEGDVSEKVEEAVKSDEKSEEITTNAPATAAASDGDEDAEPETTEAKAEEEPTADDEPISDEEPAAEEKSTTEEEPAADEKSTTEEEPPAEEKSTTEEEPPAEEEPVEEEPTEAEPAE